ncbi:Cleavage and polyadenylation specificity factor 73 [Symbiodinium microadriaticum]|uniref:Cleavage and polyadenylation specificity factor 73 n=1 Tax=Symbiodinium microadriaticum TaxID=2951 RepID=A0A1Q9EB93_SYMMI|nr:Cleavage and polyadenylation specificity factor 73 [Symbiodinium microadriaticum]
MVEQVEENRASMICRFNHAAKAEIPNVRIHVLIVESTYGVMNHEPREQREHRFTNSVHQIVRQGGKCLLPVFALGRAQEILLILEDYWELSDVRSLKRQLSQLKGLPPRFRQRLFGCGSRGSPLDDDMKLDSPTDLELVLLTYSVASPAEADELVTAARDGSITEAVELRQVRNHVEVVRLLLEANASTETRDPDGCTALFASCQSGHVEIAQVLLDGGADKNSRSYDGFTCLMMASQGGHVEIARLLVAAGAEKNVQKHGATALWAASQNGHVEVARLLLEAGADKNLTSTDMGFTCLMMASQEGHADFVRLLLETNADKDYVDFANQSGITALVMASRQGHVEVVRLLLAAGADKNVILSDGYTSLMVAAQEGRAEVVRVLVAEGVELNHANNVGVTSLMIASHRGHVEPTRLLLQAGAQKDLKDMDGITALMKASLEGHNECVQLLLAAGADTDIAEKDGFTSLMIACQEDRVEAVRLLLNASASTSLTNRVGLNALKIAARRGHSAVLRLLLEAICFMARCKPSYGCGCVSSERNSDLHEIPIFYNSPMATKCLRIFETYTNMCSVSVQEQANRCNNPWVLKYIQNMPDRHSFAAAEAEIGACVVLAAPGMLQSGASRELFESWAPDKKNGVIVTGYSVPGTLAHELKSDPEAVTLNDGRKVNVRATVKFMSFSAHSDYNQTSEFIRQLKANVVVLVHGEEHEMGRMRNKLREVS